MRPLILEYGASGTLRVREGCIVLSAPRQPDLMTLWSQGTTVEWNGSAWEVDWRKGESPAAVGQTIRVTTPGPRSWVTDPLAYPASHRANIPESCEHWKRYIVVRLVGPSWESTPSSK